MKPKAPPPPGPRRNRDMVRAGDAVAQAIAHRGLGDQIRAERLVTEWGELVGPKIAQRTRADRIVDRVLWIEVATSAWLHELNMLRAQIVRGLLERLGEPRLFDDIKFKLAGRSRHATLVRPAPRRAARPTRPLPPPATGAAREQIVREVSAVDDAELRELIARVRITHDK